MCLFKRILYWTWFKISYSCHPFNCLHKCSLFRTRCNHVVRLWLVRRVTRNTDDLGEGLRDEGLNGVELDTFLSRDGEVRASYQYIIVRLSLWLLMSINSQPVMQIRWKYISQTPPSPTTLQICSNPPPNYCLYMDRKVSYRFGLLKHFSYIQN